MMLKRWNSMPSILFDDWHKMTAFDVNALIPESVKSSREIVQFFIAKILGNANAFSLDHQQKLIDILLVENKTADEPPLTYSKEDRAYRFAHVVALILMSPQFQYR